MSALEDERSRMRFARIAANYGEWEWNIATGEVCWCEELYRVFGCNPGQKVTLSVWLDLIHEEDRGTAEVAINRAAKGETPFRTQYRICRSGEVRWLETIGNTLEETSDPSSHILTGITLDITERKQLEGDLRETNERYERDHRLLDALMQYIPEGVTIADAPDVKIRRVSRFGQQLVGRPKGSLEEIAVAEDLHARRWGILRPDGTLPLDGELPLTRSTKHGEIVEGEEWLLAHPDGRRTWILCNSGPIRDAAGSITGGVIAWRDITERKNVERALRESEERFRMASQVANEAIWELNVETKEVSCSDTYTKMFGRPEAATSAEWRFGRVHPDDKQRVIECFNGALSGTANAWECEYRFMKADGTWSHIYDRAQIARDANGKALRVVGAMLDTTELNIARQQLKVLTGLLPICAACKKIRDTEGCWHVLEAYIHDHSEAKFSHGMCPDCGARWYGSESGKAAAE